MVRRMGLRGSTRAQPTQLGQNWKVVPNDGPGCVVTVNDGSADARGNRGNWRLRSPGGIIPIRGRREKPDECGRRFLSDMVYLGRAGSAPLTFDNCSTVLLLIYSAPL